MTCSTNIPGAAIPPTHWLLEGEKWWRANKIHGVSLKFGSGYLPYALEIDDLRAQDPGRGLGTRAMTCLVDWADATAVRLVVLPAGYWRPNARLVEFYERFDFITDNGGESMFREPRHA